VSMDPNASGQKPEPKKLPPPRSLFSNPALIVVLMLLVVSVFYVVDRIRARSAINYGFFLEQLEAGNIAEARIDGLEVSGRFVDPPYYPTATKTQERTIQTISYGQLLAQLDADHIPEAPASDADGDTSSTEAIVAAVTRAIVEHRLLPGAKLVEQKLGDRFGVSRTVVRQALYRLSELKLVRLEPARGAFVAAPSIREAREVFAVRRMVESQMLRELIERIRPAP